MNAHINEPSENPDACEPGFWEKELGFSSRDMGHQYGRRIERNKPWTVDQYPHECSGKYRRPRVERLEPGHRYRHTGLSIHTPAGGSVANSDKGRDWPDGGMFR